MANVVSGLCGKAGLEAALYEFQRKVHRLREGRVTMQNIKKEQFKKRSGSYSTCGSRRGFSDLGEALDERDFISNCERVSVLRVSIRGKESLLREAKVALKTSPHRSLRSYMPAATSGKYRNNKRLSAALLDAIALADDIEKQKEELRQLSHITKLKTPYILDAVKQLFGEEAQNQVTALARIIDSEAKGLAPRPGNTKPSEREGNGGN